MNPIKPTETPRTDAHQQRNIMTCGVGLISASFARQLETELAEAKTKRELVEHGEWVSKRLCKLESIEAERDTLKAQLAEAVKDKARLDWLDSFVRNGFEMFRNVTDSELTEITFYTTRTKHDDDFVQATGKDVRTAIDSAITATKEGQ